MNGRAVMSGTVAFGQPMCRAPNPKPRTLRGHNNAGNWTITTVRPCLRSPGHDGKHKDIDGMEW